MPNNLVIRIQGCAVDLNAVEGVVKRRDTGFWYEEVVVADWIDITRLGDPFPVRIIGEKHIELFQLPYITSGGR